MLAGMALLLATTILVKWARQDILVTLVPAVFVLVATLYGGIKNYAL